MIPANVGFEFMVGCVDYKPTQVDQINVTCQDKTYSTIYSLVLLQTAVYLKPPMSFKVPMDPTVVSVIIIREFRQMAAFQQMFVTWVVAQPLTDG